MSDSKEIRRLLGHGQGSRQDIGEMKFSVRHITPGSSQQEPSDDPGLIEFALYVPTTEERKE